MLWRWFQDWRERRAALRELLRTIHDTDARLSDMASNPFLLAKAALERGKVEQAVAEWEQARVLMPNAVLKSHDTFDFLLALERYDEAEVMMQEGRKRFPHDFHYVTSLALLAQQRGDLTAAVERWANVRAFRRHDSEGYWRGAMCLRQLGRIDEAEALARRAIQVAPGREFGWLELARCAEQRKDWPEALARWRRAVERLPNLPLTAAGLGRLLLELERYDEAEAVLASAKLRHGKDLELLTVDAECAEKRGDLAAAIERWIGIKSLFRNLAQPYSTCARLLSRAARHAEADAVMLDAIDRFRDVPWPQEGYARLAHDRADWNEAVLRWSEVRRRFPGEVSGRKMGVVALREAGLLDEAAGLQGI
jgi:tetratricopeptide (TPR) repeat protein